MSLVYTPPGVTIQELTSTSVAPLLATPGSPCLVGMAAGAITRTDPIVLTGTTTATLPNLPTGATVTSSSIVSIVDATNPALDGSSFIASTDFTWNNTANPPTLARIVNSPAQGLSGAITAGATQITLTAGAVPAAMQTLRITNGATSETAVVLSISGQVVTLTTPLQNSYSTSGTTVTWGAMADGHTFWVTYSYTPSDYFAPIRLNNMSDVTTRFGAPFDATGTVVNSPLSFAASFAFQNGAASVILQPLFFQNQSTAALQQPNASQAATAATWQTVFNSLLSYEDINILVPVVGQSATGMSDGIQAQIEQYAQDWVYNMLIGNSIYTVAIVGEDSSASTTVAQEPALLSHAQQLVPRHGGTVTEQMVFINTSQFQCPNNAGGNMVIGGQYTAAAIAGMLSGQNPAQTVTRQAVSGLTAVTDQRSLQQKNLDASNGMLVVESKGSVVQVRHGITMNLTNSATRELSVVRAKHFIVDSVRDTIDTQIIGKLPADADATTILNNVVIGTLEDLSGLNMLQSYGNVQSAITSLDPTIMALQFTYRPLFVVNNVVVTFELDLTTQSITATTSTQATA